jgi:hypothetical protein
MVSLMLVLTLAAAVPAAAREEAADRPFGLARDCPAGTPKARKYDEATFTTALAALRKRTDVIPRAWALQPAALGRQLPAHPRPVRPAGRVRGRGGAARARRLRAGEGARRAAVRAPRKGHGKEVELLERLDPAEPPHRGGRGSRVRRLSVSRRAAPRPDRRAPRARRAPPSRRWRRTTARARRRPASRCRAAARRTVP